MSESMEAARLVNARRFLMGITTNNSDDVLSLLTPDVVYTVPGHSHLAGTYHGAVEVHEHIRRLFRITSGAVETLKWVDWLVGETHVAALQIAQAQGAGVIYRNRNMFVIEVDHHDLLKEIRLVFEDQDGADAFFSGLPRE
jgi:ketosteroid isomerase-like protein